MSLSRSHGAASDDPTISGHGFNMYLTHFGLQEKPFKAATDPKFLWLGARQEEALAKVVTGILRGDGVQVVTGDFGTGKTTLANAVLKELGDQVIAVVVPYPEYEGIDFFKFVAKAYGISGTLPGQESFSSRFSDFLCTAFSSGKKVVLIIDDAQRLTPSCLKELSELSKVEEKGTRLLHIVCFGENRLLDILSAESNRELLQNMTFRYALGPLTKDETAQYILHRLNVARCEREIFTPESIEEIFLYSKGIPRLINKACDVALSRNFYLREIKVLPETIRNFLKLLPEERAATAANATDSATGNKKAAASPSDQKPGDDDGTAIVREDVQKRHGNRLAYAALGCFLVISIGFTIYAMQRSEQPAPAKPESKQEAASPESRETPARPSLSKGAGKGADSSTRQQASGVSGGVRTSEGTNAQGVKAKKRPTVGSGTPANQGKRVTRGEASRKAVDEPDPDKVIDWLFNKRAEKR